MTDQWSPLFAELQERVSAQGRRRLLFQLVGELQDISMLNFGPDGEHRPQEWPRLREDYAINFHDGDQTPTLILTDTMRNSFTHSIGTNSATLANTAEYASEHQGGDAARNIPARPFFPVTMTGELTPYALAKFREILDSHFEVSQIL